jgi:hypothetical protein
LIAQNPAETACSQRKDHARSNAPFAPHAVAELTLPGLAELSFGHLLFAPLANYPTPLLKIPAMDSIQNRPPPVA